MNQPTTDLDLTMNKQLEQHEREFAKDRHPAGRHRKPPTVAEKKRAAHLRDLLNIAAGILCLVAFIIAMTILAEYGGM